MTRVIFQSLPLLALLAAVAAATGCSTISPPVTQAGKVSAYARQDLYVKVDSTPSVLGTAVAPYKAAGAYHVFIASSAALDVIFIENCHRSWVEFDKGKAYKTGDGGTGYSYEFDYQMTAENEKTLCPLFISTLEKKGRRKNYATIAFQHPSFSLSADLRCNGRRVAPAGVALCQAKHGKMQEIHFAEKVKLFTHDKTACPLPTDAKGQPLDLATDFEFSLPTGTCTYGVTTYNPPFKHMVFHTVGYEEDEYPEEL